MSNIEKIKAEIARLKKWSESSKKEWIDEGYNQNAFAEDCRIKSFDKLLDFIDSLPEEKPSEDLKEAAEEYRQGEVDSGCDYIDDSDGDSLYHSACLADAFIAGAEWQKEQDQPITGNSLEQEWLRYVDKKKKECRGELPALGEYGWLQIARHFANWQKKKDRETIELAEEHAILAGRIQMKEEMLKDAVEGEVIYDLGGFFRIKSEAIDGAKYKVGSWVKLIIVKED